MYNFKVGQKYKTRSGEIAEIINTKYKTEYWPIAGYVHNKKISWSKHGYVFNKNCLDPDDLVELIEDVPTVKGNEMNKHRNYEFIVAFAAGKEVEYFCNKWHKVTDLYQLSGDTQLRMKPKTKTINGFEVPVPMDKEPKPDSKYYYADVNNDELYFSTWYTASYDKLQFKRGLCFSNKEDAIKTSRAMLGIDPNT